MTATSAASPAQEAERALLQRWPESRIEPSLERIRAVTDALGRPQHAVPVIHVTGTNGKTTSARIMDDLLRAAGLRVGRYTSPHLATVRERIVLDGQPIDAGRFAALHARLRPVVDDVDRSTGTRLSFFEVVTAMAFQAFAEAGLDAVVLEVGMGGTWDATNVADGRVAVVTPVSLDHTEYLGPDVASIATEKAGIIKPGAVAVLADQPPSAMRVLVDRIHQVGATRVPAGVGERILRRVPTPTGQQLDLRGLTADHRDLSLPLLGLHQAANAAAAVTAVEAFLAEESRTLHSDTVRAVLREVRSPGRLETVRTSPRVWVDASHNPAGMVATSAAIRELPSVSRLVVVLACLEGKDVRAMLRALRGIATEVIVTENASPRRMRADVLARHAVDVLGPERVSVQPDLARAVQAAVDSALGDADAGVLITGSVVTAGEARALLAD
jgi:dihydrofolate synthase/folylpolyglutamate synthase